MRFICGLVFALLIATVHAEEPVILNSDFCTAAAAGKVSVGEMLRRLRIVAPHLGEEKFDHPLDFRDVFGMAARKANDAELDELGAMLRAIKPGWLEFDGCFSSYMTARIRQRVAALVKKPQHLTWPPAPEALPKELADAPPSFQEAWKLHQAVIAPYLAVVLPPEKAGVSKQMPELEVDLRRVIGKPEPGAWKLLAGHIWGNWCGTGSEMLYHPRNRALLLSFLADGKLPEAAGAALMQAPNDFPYGHEIGFDPVIIDLLGALGLDWEQVLFGSVLPVHGYNMGNGRAVISRGFSECDAWHLLAARGSERVLGQCLGLIRRKKLDPSNAAEFLVTALGTEPLGRGSVDFSTDVRSVRTVALPPAARRDVLAVFAEYLAPSNRPEDLVETMEKIPSSCGKELREPLGVLLSHPVHAVAARSLALLRSAGLASGKEKIATAFPPLRFRLLLNGKPLADTEVYVTAEAEVRPGETVSPESPAPAPSRDLTTDAHGDIQYALDEAIDPARIARVQLSLGSARYTTELDDLIAPLPSPPGTPSPPENEWPGPWIDQKVAVRTGDAQVHEVALHAADLEVELSGFDGMAPEAPIKVFLRRAEADSLVMIEPGVAKAKTKAGGSAFFRRLEPHHYRVFVMAPGAANYQSDEIAVEEGTVVHEVKLQRGYTVRGMVVLPGGGKWPLTSMADLYRDGVQVRPQASDEWKGLTAGKYTVHIPSTREDEETSKKLQLPKMLLGERNAGLEMSLTIDASTPSTLDLGEIVVPLEK